MAKRSKVSPISLVWVAISLILVIGTALVLTYKQLDSTTLVGQVGAANYQRYDPHANYPMGPCDVRFQSPPEVTTVVTRSETPFRLDFRDPYGSGSPCPVQPVTLKMYMFKYPASLSDDSTRVTLFTSSPSARSDGRYCVFGAVYRGGCNLWPNFDTEPNLKMLPPDPITGAQRPGYTTRAEFCYPSGNGGCWFYEQAVWKNSKFCNTATDCGCRSAGNVCSVMNKNAAVKCVSSSGVAPACLGRGMEFGCVDHDCKAVPVSR